MLIEEVFNKLMNVKDKKSLIYLGVFVTVIGVFVGRILFPNDYLPAIFFATMPLVHFATKIFEKKMSNYDIAKIYICLFIGMIIVFTFFYLYLSEHIDVSVYENIPKQDPFMLFSSIINNNVRLIFILFLLSMLYSIGSIFILTFNAALLGQLLSSFIFYQRPDLLVSFMPHVFSEFLGFFLAAIAGAVVGIVFTKHEKRTKETDEKILRSSILFTFSIMAIILGAFLESFILPYLISAF